jgi:hypothetical protein
LLSQALLVAVQLPAHRADDGDWSRQRDEIRRFLLAMPGQHLVLVDGHRDWVANAADLEAAPIVWARRRDPERDRILLEAFPKRRLWTVDARVERPWLQPAARSAGGGEILLERPRAH